MASLRCTAADEQASSEVGRIQITVYTGRFYGELGSKFSLCINSIDRPLQNR